MIEERFDRSDKQIDELTEKLRAINQRLAGLEHEARKPRLATEADVEPDAKICKSTEDAAADQAKHGDRSSSAQIDHDPMRPISFGDYSTEPPAPEKPIGEALVDECTEAPKPSQISTLSLGVVLRSPCVSRTCYVNNDMFFITYAQDFQSFLWRGGWFRGLRVLKKYSGEHTINDVPVAFKEDTRRSKYNPKRRKYLSED